MRISLWKTTISLLFATLPGGQPIPSTAFHDAEVSSRHDHPLDHGLITLSSSHTVDETIARVARLLATKAVKLFTVIDHSGETEAIGQHMPPTKLMIFGSPQAGTPLMLASPGIAIDLPLKLLVAQDAAGRSTITCNAPEYLRARHHLPEELVANIAVIAMIAQKAAE